MKMMKKLKQLGEEGFTLVEMLIVVALIGMILALVGGNLIKQFTGAKVSTTKAQMKLLGTMLDDFNRVCGFYPSTDQGLDALIKAPSGRECKGYPEEGFVKNGKLPKDAWNNDFIYSSEGSNYEIKSLGADVKEGGDGYDKDISSNDT